MKLYLSSHCRFVKGYTGAAIYNLYDGKVYSLNNSGKDIIERLISNDFIPTEIEAQYLQKLQDLGLLTEHNVAISNEIVSPKLNYAWLELTDICNLRCIHCYGNWGYKPADSSVSMNINNWKDTIDQLRLLGCDRIQFIGGEPSIFKEFTDILKYAHLSGMKRIDIFTNAMVLNKVVIKNINDVGASVRVSLYGHCAEIHDKITQTKGSFAKTDIALKTLKEAGVRTSIAVIIMKENQEYLKQIKEYIISVGHKYNGYDTIRKVVGGEQGNHMLTDTELLKPRYQTKASFFTSKHSFAVNSVWNSCWFGKIAITATGDVLPCIFARNEIAGNVKRGPLSNIINGKILEKWAVTKDKVKVCCDCEYRYACHDCRPLAFTLTNNSGDSKYPRCCYNPYSGEWESIKNITLEIAN